MLGTTAEVLASHYLAMGKKKKTDEHPGWYVREWLLFTGKKQVDLVKHTGWNKGTVSDLISGKERFNRDHLLGFSAVIGCPPGALVDVDPSTEAGRVMARLLLARGRVG